MGEKLISGSYKITNDGVNTALFVCDDRSGFWLYIYDGDGQPVNEPTFTEYHHESYTTIPGEPAPDFSERHDR